MLLVERLFCIDFKSLRGLTQVYKWYNNNIYKLIVKKKKSLDCALFCCKAHRNWLEHEESARVAGAKGGGGGGGRKVRKRSIKREGSACYKSRCFFIPHTITITSTVKT